MSAVAWPFIICAVMAATCDVPSAPSDLGCENPFPGEDFCGACNGTCYYCRPNTCITPCDLDAGFPCVDGQPAGIATQRKAMVLSVAPDPVSGYQLAVDSGLSAAAEVTWFSSREGRLETTGTTGTLCLSQPGTHYLTFEAKLSGKGGGEPIISEPLVVEVQ